MRSSRAVRSGAGGNIAASLAMLTTACAGQSAGLVGTIAEGTSAGAPATPGRPADYTAYLADHTGHAVMLKSAQLIPLKGFRAPGWCMRRSRPVARSRRRIETGRPQGQALPLAAFAGYRIPAGREVRIVYSVIARMARWSMPTPGSR